TPPAVGLPVTPAILLSAFLTGRNPQPTIDSESCFPPNFGGLLSSQACCQFLSPFLFPSPQTPRSGRRRQRRHNPLAPNPLLRPHPLPQRMKNRSPTSP